MALFIPVDLSPLDLVGLSLFRIESKDNIFRRGESKADLAFALSCRHSRRCHHGIESDNLGLVEFYDEFSLKALFLVAYKASLVRPSVGRYVGLSRSH